LNRSSHVHSSSGNDFSPKKKVIRFILQWLYKRVESISRRVPSDPSLSVVYCLGPIKKYVVYHPRRTHPNFEKKLVPWLYDQMMVYWYHLSGSADISLLRRCNCRECRSLLALDGGHTCSMVRDFKLYHRFEYQHIGHAEEPLNI
jgi:hypothetical protein